MANPPFIVSYPHKLRTNTSANSPAPVTDYVTFTTIEDIKTRFDNLTNPLQGLSNYNVSSKYNPIRTTPTTVASVGMYMPQKISETYTQGWNNYNLEYEVSKAARGRAVNFGEVAVKSAEKQGFKSLIENLGKLSNANLSDNAILSATSGIIYNPMAEVLYDGPEFRSFNYNFTLFASSEQDAKNIYKIVEFFRNASVPSFTSRKVGDNLNALLGLAAGQISGNIGIGAAQAALQARGARRIGVGARGGAATGAQGEAAAGNPNASFNVSELLNSISQDSSNLTSIAGLFAVSGGIGIDSRFISQPPLVLVQYKRGNGLHPYIKSPKPCVIKSLDIDFTPSGSYTILNNFGEPEVATVVATTISMVLVETRVVYREDFYNLPEPREAPPENNAPNAPLTPGSANNPIGNAQLITPP